MRKEIILDFQVNLEMIKYVQEELNRYDNTRPRLDELKFMQSISDKYNLTRKQTIKLIQYVRRLNRR